MKKLSLLLILLLLSSCSNKAYIEKRELNRSEIELLETLAIPNYYGSVDIYDFKMPSDTTKLEITYLELSDGVWQDINSETYEISTSSGEEGTISLISKNDGNRELVVNSEFIITLLEFEMQDYERDASSWAYNIMEGKTNITDEEIVLLLTLFSDEGRYSSGLGTNSYFDKEVLKDYHNGIAITIKFS